MSGLSASPNFPQGWRPITTALASFDQPAEAQSAITCSPLPCATAGTIGTSSWTTFTRRRGLVSASLEAPGGRSFTMPLRWKIQGRQGGEDLADVARRPANIGGQYGERRGWHLPGFDDARWQAASVPATSARAATT